MITSSRISPLSLHLSRRLEFTRLQNQLIVDAYQILIPVVSRSVQQPRPRRNYTATVQSVHSKAGGACRIMIKNNLRAAVYARVSGEQQEKEDTIASQLESVTRRIADDGLE